MNKHIFFLIVILLNISCSKSSDSSKPLDSDNPTTVQQKLNHRWISYKIIDETNNISKDVTNYEQFKFDLFFDKMANGIDLFKTGTFEIDSNTVFISSGNMQLIGDDTLELIHIANGAMISNLDTSHLYVNYLSRDSLSGVLHYRNFYDLSKKERNLKIYCISRW